MRIVLSVGLVALLTACGSMRTFEIETYNPSEVTFPEATRTVLVVNHAVPQPEDVGYKSEIMGEGEKVERARADSALYDACHALGEAMMRSDYFSDVLLYHDTLRTDSLYYLDQRLTSAERVTVPSATVQDSQLSVSGIVITGSCPVVEYVKETLPPAAAISRPSESSSEVMSKISPIWDIVTSWLTPSAVMVRLATRENSLSLEDTVKRTLSELVPSTVTQDLSDDASTEAALVEISISPDPPAASKSMSDCTICR